jgi:hypothetical protein
MVSGRKGKSGKFASRKYSIRSFMRLSSKHRISNQHQVSHHNPVILIIILHSDFWVKESESSKVSSVLLVGVVPPPLLTLARIIRGARKRL